MIDAVLIGPGGGAQIPGVMATDQCLHEEWSLPKYVHYTDTRVSLCRMKA